MAEENSSIEVVKAGFKALLTVLIQIREGKNGEPRHLALGCRYLECRRVLQA